MTLAECERRIAELESKHGPETHVQLFSFLVNLELSSADAASHWERVLAAWRELNRAVPGEVDLRIAVLHYFLEVQRRLESPVIVEIRLFQRVQQSVIYDELTQLYNYRYFRDRIEQEVKRTDRFNTSTSLLMIDVDDFKSFNDRFGHQEGNAALSILAGVLRRSVRDVDIVARFGGEEFAVLLPNTPKNGAMTVARKIQSRLEQVEPHRLTVSMGAATSPVDARSWEDLVRRADEALYRAKRLGKNRIELYSENRREFPRFDVALIGRMQRLDRRWLPITTANVSQGGLLIHAESHLPVGRLVQLEVAFGPESHRLSCTARVVRTVPLRSHYQVGVEILHAEALERYRFKEFLAGLDRSEPSGGRSAEAAVDPAGKNLAERVVIGTFGS